MANKDADKKRVYMVTLNAEDEDGKVEPSIEDVTDAHCGTTDTEDLKVQLCDFLSQTNESYIDKNGWVVEVYNGVHQPLGTYVNDIGDKTMNKIYKQIEGYGQKDAIPIIQSQVKELRTANRESRKMPDVPGIQADNEAQYGD